MCSTWYSKGSWKLPILVSSTGPLRMTPQQLSQTSCGPGGSTSVAGNTCANRSYDGDTNRESRDYDLFCSITLLIEGRLLLWEDFLGAVLSAFDYALIFSLFSIGTRTIFCKSPDWSTFTTICPFLSLNYIELRVDRAWYLFEILFTLRYLRPCICENPQCLIKATENALKGIPLLVILFSSSNCRFSLR
jgi:hypothetical protein